MLAPNMNMSEATRKNRMPRPTIDAIINVVIGISQTPAAIVKILYGMGVNAAVNIAHNALSLYLVQTMLKVDSSKMWAV
jgi:hypothetical protein